MTPMEAIQAERRRQVEAEGWTLEHDDKHEKGDLLRAAVCYYLNATQPDMLGFDEAGAPLGWPWERARWKPKGPQRDLERAGALALAEKECILRRFPKAWTGHCDQKLDLIVAAMGRLETVQS